MIKASQVKQLRDKTGTSMMACKKALEESKGDEKRAIEILREKGTSVAQKKSARSAESGLVVSYIHNDKIGVLLELNCETDFVSRNEEFKKLANDIAMHIAGMNPRYISPEEIPEELIQAEKEIYKKQLVDSGKPTDILNKVIEGKIQKYSQEISLLNQSFVKDADITIGELIKEKIVKLGENIKVGKFTRYEL